jgi:hypothetical protein
LRGDVLQREIRKQLGRASDGASELRTDEQRVPEKPVNDLATIKSVLPPTSKDGIEKISRFEDVARTMPQVKLDFEHVLHGGMYARTVRLAARVAITSVLIKIPTVIVVNGLCRVFADKWFDLEGFNVIPASDGRKMIYITAAPTQITMFFPSNAETVEEAEKEFTDEYEDLLSERNDVVTGEQCRA